MLLTVARQLVIFTRFPINLRKVKPIPVDEVCKELIDSEDIKRTNGFKKVIDLFQMSNYCSVFCQELIVIYFPVPVSNSDISK